MSGYQFCISLLWTAGCSKQELNQFLEQIVVAKLTYLAFATANVVGMLPGNREPKF